MTPFVIAIVYVDQQEYSLFVTCDTYEEEIKRDVQRCWIDWHLLSLLIADSRIHREWRKTTAKLLQCDMLMTRKFKDRKKTHLPFSIDHMIVRWGLFILIHQSFI